MCIVRYIIFVVVNYIVVMLFFLFQVSLSKVSAVGMVDDIPANSIKNKTSANAGSSNRPSLPPIVLKDAFGQHLDTDSGYQRAINQARWTVVHRTRDTPIGPEEWRLPGGPLPARPDFSRMAPPRVVTKDALRTSLPERGYVSTDFSQELMPESAAQDVFQKVRGIRKRSNSLPDLLVFIALSKISIANSGVKMRFQSKQSNCAFELLCN